MAAPDLSTRAIENATLRIEYLTGAGPRLLRLISKESKRNLFAEIPQVYWETFHGRYYPFGGHRLWRSPEVPEITYYPDNLPPRVEELADGVRLTGSSDAPDGICKSMEIHLDAQRPLVTIDHVLSNRGTAEVECAPWAITQLAPGGWAILPNHPFTGNPTGFQPDRALALWPYTHLSDPRLHFRDNLILVHSDATVEPCKVGLRSAESWLGYYHAGVYFRKQSHPDWSQAYPDFGCNLEVYANNTFLELETLGPLVKLAPGARLTHRETWQVWAGLDVAETPDALAELAQKLF